MQHHLQRLCLTFVRAMLPGNGAGSTRLSGVNVAKSIWQIATFKVSRQRPSLYLNPWLVNPLQRIPSRKARSPSDSLAVSLSIKRPLIHEHQLNQSSSCLHSILHAQPSVGHPRADPSIPFMAVDSHLLFNFSWTKSFFGWRTMRVNKRPVI
jgi:hypothetical protein